MSKEIEDKIQVMMDAMDALKADNEQLKKQVANYADKVSASAVDYKPQAPKPLVNPGNVKIDKNEYAFKYLSFEIFDADTGFTKYIAEDVAKDKALCAELLEKNPSIFVKV
jgi:hypothetical protein